MQVELSFSLSINFLSFLSHIHIIAFTYYAILETWSDEDRENFQLFMDLPIQGAIKATTIHHHHQPHLTTPINNKTVFLITPTYTRHTQKVDLLTLCQTLTLSSTRVVWIVVEDSKEVTQLVTNVLYQCPVRSVHLAIKSIQRKRLNLHRRVVNRKRYRHRGVGQRNLGLKWLRDNYSIENCSMGVVYFADDDNRYDHRLFNIVSHTCTVI